MADVNTVRTAHERMVAAENAADDARLELAAALSDANDAGHSYRQLAEVLPWSFGYVAQLIQAHRSNTQDGAA